jgi:acyl-coenzyme A thioesterase 9
MEDTKLQSVHVTQPQVRNIHNFVFGGHLMQLATELAFATGCQFIKRQPEFLAIDNITFRKSVPIGSILKFKSKVTFARPKSFQVAVKADVIDFEQSMEETTNIFNFSLSIPSAPQDQISHPLEILPKSYAESMQYLEGKRRLDKGKLMAERENTALRHEY